ncbi:MAG: glycosyltransferase family 4 protein [Bryobacteraceae bacterium]|jgi:glycosyltransferase involved in cell wall biosynthesis
MKILLLNQCFYPDVVSTAQHASDLVAALAERGHEVTVVAGTRAYDNPRIKFPKREQWRGSRILRVPCLALGKSAKWRRAANFASFFLSCILRILFLPRYDVVMALTSPPLISLLGALYVKLKGGRFIFWVMDLNPDEAVAAGWLRHDSVTARILAALLNFSLVSADEVVVLDRFMRKRVMQKGVPAEKISVIPPWAHSNVVRYDPDGRLAFRERHGLEGKYVVMYSGNHSPCHPLTTVLQAAQRLADRPEIVFCFVGGGSEFSGVAAFAAAHNLPNIRSLPYQPLAILSASLSAADLHVVVMGDPLVGIVHTCKIYNIMCIGAPVLYIGPAKSHVMDIAAGNGIPLSSANHGDVDLVVRRILANIKSGAKLGVPDKRMVERGRSFHQDQLVPRFADLVEALPEQAAAAAVGSHALGD